MTDKLPSREIVANNKNINECKESDAKLETTKHKQNQRSNKLSITLDDERVLVGSPRFKHVSNRMASQG